MPLVRVDALLACDGCSKRFGIEIDTAFDFAPCGVTHDLEYAVRETIMGGGIGAVGYTWGVRGTKTVDRFPLSGFPTIQGDYLLCDECTRKCDDLPIEEPLTKAEVEKVLGINQGE